MFIVRFIIIVAELILCYVFQSSVCGVLTLNDAVPDLLMIIVVSASYIKGCNAGIVYGFCAGFILDLTYGTHLGYFALIYLFCGFLTGLFHRFYRKDDNITPLLLITAGVFLCQSIYYVTEFLIKGRFAYHLYFTGIIMPKLVYTILIAAVLYKLCQISILWTVRLEEQKTSDYD